MTQKTITVKVGLVRQYHLLADGATGMAPVVD